MKARVAAELPINADAWADSRKSRRRRIKDREADCAWPLACRGQNA
jgi:hypothetical protein